MGPLVTARAPRQGRGYVDNGVATGATLVVDGRRPEVAGTRTVSSSGRRSSTTSTPEMTIYKDEIFGPVLVVLRVDDARRGDRAGQRNPYANGAALFTASGGAARRFEDEIEVGMVGINVPIPVPMAFFSFGGWKNSLFGDLHVHGMEGVRFYTRGKAVTARWPDPGTSKVDLGFPRTR